MVSINLLKHGIDQFVKAWYRSICMVPINLLKHGTDQFQDSRFKIQKNLFNINRFTCIIFTKQINKHKYTTIIARRSHQ